ncbi:hypothetical protein [Bacillus paranthracis]|uniref:hypothetical protein n=1 Tax=Bacillus paranthracis TaxID=2026186 RepID=UPI002DB7C4D6|nr:hypothetical protein [Bacillus paranthracis]MEC1630141.1 hypothetical protein [Bacillus paranthracis]
MIAMFVIKLVYGILTGAGAGVVIGRRYVGPWLISVYKKARTTLLRGKGKGGSRLKR